MDRSQLSQFIRMISRTFGCELRVSVTTPELHFALPSSRRPRDIQPIMQVSDKRKEVSFPPTLI